MVFGKGSSGGGNDSSWAGGLEVDRTQGKDPVPEDGSIVTPAPSVDLTVVIVVYEKAATNKISSRCA